MTEATRAAIAAGQEWADGQPARLAAHFEALMISPGYIATHPMTDDRHIDPIPEAGAHNAPQPDEDEADWPDADYAANRDYESQREEEMLND